MTFSLRVLIRPPVGYAIARAVMSAGPALDRLRGTASKKRGGS
jgi:hypothetical protein